MSQKQILLVLLMSLFTLLPRWLPLLFSKFTMPFFLQEWVKCIPYAALAALIFPGIFFADKADINVGILGLITSAILALLKVPVYFVVVGAILAVYGYYTW